MTPKPPLYDPVTGRQQRYVNTPRTGVDVTVAPEKTEPSLAHHQGGFLLMWVTMRTQFVISWRCSADSRYGLRCSPLVEVSSCGTSAVMVASFNPAIRIVLNAVRCRV